MKTTKINITDELMSQIVEALYVKVDDDTFKVREHDYDSDEPDFESELFGIELPIPTTIVDKHFENYDNSNIKFISDNSNGKFTFEIMQCEFETRRVNIGDIENIPETIKLKNGIYNFKKIK